MDARARTRRPRPRTGRRDAERDRSLDRDPSPVHERLLSDVSQALVRLRHQDAALVEAHDALKHEQARLVAHEKLRSTGTLAAGIAHEIGNPLSLVLGGVDELEGRLAALRVRLGRKPDLAPLLDALRDDARIIRGGGERIAAIARALAGFARDQEEGHKPVDLREALGHLREILQPALGEGTELAASGEAALVRGNPRELHDVLYHLVLNAAQAVHRDGRGGRIDVTFARDGDEVVVRVHDDGPGVPYGIRDRIFDPFFTTRPVGQGAGLGLAICHGIVRRHRGTIACVGDGPGATFEVRLPALDRARHAPTPHPEALDG